MSRLFDEAVERVHALPPEMQDEAARLLLAYTGDSRQVIQLTPEEEADLAEADAEVARGEFATEAEIAAVFAKYRP